MKIGSNIRKLRSLRGYSQEFMAGKLGMSQNNYHKIESNVIDITVKRLNEISTLLEVDANTLMNFDEKHVFHNTFHNNSENNSGANMIYNSENFETERQLYERLLAAKEQEIKIKEEYISFLKAGLK